MKYTLIAKQRISGKAGAIVTVPLLTTIVATMVLANIPIVPAFLSWTYGAPAFGGW